MAGGGGGVSFELNAGLQTVHTQPMDDLALKFRDNIQVFEGYREEMENISNRLMANWVGKGRNKFEAQYNILRGQFQDISDELYDIYDALIDAETAYVETDNEIAKAFKS